MTKIYGKTFGVAAEDRERDAALAARMVALAFVRPEHLDIPELYQDQKAWLLAIKELHKINNYKVRAAEMAGCPAQSCAAGTVGTRSLSCVVVQLAGHWCMCLGCCESGSRAVASHA